MDLEVRSIPAKDRQKYNTRLKSYQTELSRLEKDLVSDDTGMSVFRTYPDIRMAFPNFTSGHFTLYFYKNIFKHFWTTNWMPLGIPGDIIVVEIIILKNKTIQVLL